MDDQGIRWQELMEKLSETNEALREIANQLHGLTDIASSLPIIAKDLSVSLKAIATYVANKL